MQVTVCAHYIVKTNDTGSNMAVMEIFMPSGFTVNKDSIPALYTFEGVKKVETDRDDTKVVVFFDTITKIEQCLTVEAFRTHRVANQKPVPVVVYDYYDQSRRARSFYDVVPATLCDICEEEDCPDQGCPNKSPNFEGYYFSSYREAYGEGRAGSDRRTGAGGLVLSLLCLLLSLL